MKTRPYIRVSNTVILTASIASFTPYIQKNAAGTITSAAIAVNGHNGAPLAYICLRDVFDDMVETHFKDPDREPTEAEARRLIGDHIENEILPHIFDGQDLMHPLYEP